MSARFSLGHVVLKVSSLERSVPFCEKVFGLLYRSERALHIARARGLRLRDHMPPGNG